MIRKYNFATGEYEDYSVPKDWYCPLYREDLSTVINCTNCGVVTTFAVCYTSKTIHNDIGFGYPVCNSCYKQELFQESKYIRQRNIKQGEINGRSN